MELNVYGIPVRIEDALRDFLRAELRNLKTGELAVPVAAAAYNELNHTKDALGFEVDPGESYYLRVAGLTREGVVFVEALPRCMTVPN